MATSAVPHAITQLITILRARPELQEDVVVLDGPPAEDVSRIDVIAVGWSAEGDQAVELAQNFNAAGARTRNEDFAIHGVIDVWIGDPDISIVRARAFELFGVIEDAIRASGPNPTAPTLNGAVLWAHLTNGALRQYFADQGARAALGFTVTCHARI
jgi:hypothetical protein